MEIKIKETRILTLTVRIASRATKEQVEQEVRKQLRELPLDCARHIPWDGRFELWKDGTVLEENKLARCEVGTEAKVDDRVILSVDGH
jgi:hypothetical protein